MIRTATVGFGGEINQTDTGYDLLGRAAFVSIPYTPVGTGPTSSGNYTKTLFDVYNRPTEVTYPGGRQDELSYGMAQACGGTTYYGTSRTQTYVAPDLHERTEIQDVNGNRLCVIDENGNVTTYTYDAANNISSVDGPMAGTQDKLTIEYNHRGWKTEMSDPDKGDWTYTYYPTGELESQIDGNHQITTYEYDLLGRVVRRVDEMNTPTPTIEDAQTTTYQYVNGTGGEYGKAQLQNVFICKGLSDTCSGDNRPYSQAVFYDQFGRVYEADTTLNRMVSGESISETFTTETVYDGAGRVFQEFERFMDVYRPNSGLQYNYNANGYLASLQESRGGSGGLVYQLVESMDAWGNVILSGLGNGVIVSVDYDPLTGRLINTLATVDPEIHGNNAIVQDLHYDWDLIGNLKLKKDVTSNSADIITHEQTETYTYDLLNRLETVELSSPQLGISNFSTMSLFYDEAGNITGKAGMSYTYGESAASCTYQAGPHAVSTYDGVTYCYDINGNNTDSSDGRSITYTSYNKPKKIELGADASEFFYGPNRSRYRRVETINNQIIEEAFYIGNTEIIDKDDGLRREYRRNIGGIAIEHFYLRLDGSAGEKTDYVLQDNLGSPHTLLDELGQITYRVGFDAHGSRREGYDPRALIEGSNPLNDVTDRGFTGHEHLDVLGVIHVNE